MSAMEEDSIAGHVSSLRKSFGLVPSAAVPAILDCILDTTGISPSLLFSSLLDDLPNLIKDNISDENGILGPDECNSIASFMRALCHILKKYGSNDDAVKLTICRGFIPLTKILNGSNCELLNQIVELIIEVVIKSNTWGAIEETLIPYSLRSVGLSLGMLENDESSFYRWSRGTFVQVPRSKLCEPILDEGSIFSLSGFLPLPISCHILTSVVAAALRFYQSSQSTLESTLENGCHIGKFIGNVLWDLCELLFRMLLQCAEHRSCATCILVPFIFWAFSSHDSFGVSPHKQPFVFSRNYFCRKIWMCCTTLFSLGPSERKDAYGVMSLYLSFFSTTKGSTDGVSNGLEEFDVTAEKELWDEIKKALVDKDGVVRKQSLHMLKKLLQTEEGTPCVSKKNLQEKISNPRGMTRRAQWAEKEAKSLGVGRIIHSPGSCSNARQRWEAFLLLYEMLEEYGTHLVEAAWAHQIAFLLQVSCLHGSSMNSVSGGVYLVQMETTEGIFTWLAILWERGFSHENPQVRCLIMRSFLSIDWKNSGNNAKLVPESFILSSFIPGLNDPVHHKDFGVKGVYTSETIEGAISFLYQFSGHFHLRARLVFLCSLASVSKQHSFGRAGLMALAACISSAGRGAELHYDGETQWCKDISCGICQQESVQESVVNDKGNLLDILRLIIESSKQHFNSCYRLQVCQKVIEAAALVIYSSDLPLEMLLHFVSALPREFTDCGGSLGVKLQEWFSRCSEKHCHSNSCSTKTQVLKCLYDYPKIFIKDCIPHDSVAVYDDEEVDAWGVEAERWSRVLFLVVTEEDHLEPLFKEKTTSGIMRATSCERVNFPDTISQRISAETASFFNKFCQPFLFILEELVSFAKTACAIFWSNNVVDTVLPSSLRGKLGGPSQRRLAASTTTSVLQAIISMKAVALISSWCALFKSDVLLDFSFTFLWRFYWKVVSFPTRDSETCAEIRLAAYEALVPVLKALTSASSILSLNSIVENDESQLPNTVGGGLLDPLVLSFLQNINNLLATGVLTRSRRAILMNWKWLCLDSILSLPFHATLSGAFSDGLTLLFSDGFVRCVFADLVERSPTLINFLFHKIYSLENAGEGSVLPILRSVRLVLGLFALGRTSLAVSSSDGVNVQMMWQLVHSSWVLHVNCNKRRVAAIAALLSSVLHSSVFSDANMHKTNDDTPGPLKWFVMKILEEGTKSPRTIRLAALHLTGLWFSYPRTIRYYLKELKLLSLYGSVAFDEDFEAELAEIHEARTEVSLLAKSPDPELTEAFINTELYARVSVGVLFCKLAKLADTLGSDSENEDCHLALESGKLFLLELLDSAVNEKDLAKELYKKYSAIHRRKVRVWQMICILSGFVDEEIVQQVTFSLHICLNRNNLPAVRQYLETFAIHIYLKFPSLVRQQLLPIFQDYNMRPQALASYVFITANVILHATEMRVQSRHLNDLLPHIVPLLTSHHHSLRGFTQLLVYQVLSKVMPALDSNVSGIMSLEKNCFENLKLYLSKNPDCTRLRASMEGFLDAFNPEISATPNGIFANRDKELQFECVPTSLMEQVIFFLNDAREDLRCSMANDIVTIKNDYLKLGESSNSVEGSRKANEERFLTGFPKDVLFDFQKKVTLSKHESKDADPSSMFSNIEIFKPLLEMEKEDLLLDDLLQSRNISSERIRASRQPFILVASLLDRIPNLAGLARSCEVFKATGLSVADATIIHDKQFQLISVTSEKWVPIIEVPVCSLKAFLKKKKQEGFSILGLEQTANSIPLDQYAFPKKMVLVLGREKEGIPVDIIHVLDACVEIPQLGVVRSLNAHVSGAIALWEYTRQQRSLQSRSS